MAKIRLYRGQIVKTHLNEFFANRDGLKGSMEAEVLYVDVRQYRAKVRLQKTGTELYVPLRAVVADLKKKTFQNNVSKLVEKFNAGN